MTRVPMLDNIGPARSAEGAILYLWGEQTMEESTLLEIIAHIGQVVADEDVTIYATKPWTSESRAILLPQPEDGRAPSEATCRGMTYFMEVCIAEEFLTGWLRNLAHSPTRLEKCDRLIRFAIYDA